MGSEMSPNRRQSLRTPGLRQPLLTHYRRKKTFLETWEAIDEDLDPMETIHPSELTDVRL